MGSGTDYEMKFKTLEEVQAAFKKFNLEEKFDIVKPHLRSKISFDVTPVDDLDLETGQSKLGGNPDLEDEDMWPKHNENYLSFIAQINCEEVAPYDEEELLPKKGLLSFFYSLEKMPWGYSPKHAGLFKVLYTEDVSTLEQTDAPGDLEEDYLLFGAGKLKFEKRISLPSLEHPCVEDVFEDDFDDESEADSYSDMSGYTTNHLLGHADCVQSAMELQCQLVTNSIGRAEDLDEATIKALTPGQEDWILLLQIDSQDNIDGMMWGDYGKLYFWIKKQDLKTKNFDNVWVILQCH